MGSVLSRAAARLPRKAFVRLVALEYLLFEPELRHMRSFVPSDRIAVDAGTWWGPWTWWLAKRVSRVEAFEPNAPICNELRTILPANVRLHNVALSDVRGESNLWSPREGLGTEGRSTLFADGSSGWVAQKVETVPLDEFGLTGVGFVKIDVEGSELAVLQGGVALLKRERPNLMVEIEETHQPGNMERVFEFLDDLGYHGTFLRGGRWHPLGDFDRDEAMRDSRRYTGAKMLRYSISRETYIHNFLFVM
jgi:FkbM family methyltransferase